MLPRAVSLTKNFAPFGTPSGGSRRLKFKKTLDNVNHDKPNYD